MKFFKRKRIRRTDNIVLAPSDDEAGQVVSPLGRAEAVQPHVSAPGKPKGLNDLSDLELFGAFVISRRDGDGPTMDTVQRELERRGKAVELARL